jgi:hypothetical protein
MNERDTEKRDDKLPPCVRRCESGFENEIEKMSDDDLLTKFNKVLKEDYEKLYGREAVEHIIFLLDARKELGKRIYAERKKKAAFREKLR